MPWNERQRAMLRGMGLRVWQPPEVSVPAAAPEPAQRSLQASGASGAAGAPGVPGTTTPAEPPAGAAAGLPRPALPAAPLSTPQAGQTPLVPAPPALPAADAAAHAAVASADWPELRAAVAACRACRLCEGRKQTVFGVGHLQAHWMIVGEAPGAQEDEQGEPFVGAAGQLLDAMLRALDLSRAAQGEAARRVFIANTLKCRPPGNRNPQPDEMARCEPFLVRQIQLVRPRLILAMGRFAVQTLLRTDEPIGRLRGRVHRYQGVPLVVTYHPAYLLRNLPDKARAWEDLCLAADTMERGAGPPG